MSADYYWAPVIPPPPPGGWFSCGMASMLASWLAGPFDRDDSHAVHDAELGDRARTWLEGVLASSGDEEIRRDATELIAAIDKHGTIRLIVER